MLSMMVAAPACGGSSPTSEHYAYVPEGDLRHHYPVADPLCPCGRHDRSKTRSSNNSRQHVGFGIAAWAALLCGGQAPAWWSCGRSRASWQPVATTCAFAPHAAVSAGPLRRSPSARSLCVEATHGWLSFADSSAGDGFRRKASLGRAPSAAATGAVCCGGGGGGRGSPSSGGASSRWSGAEGGGAPPLLTRLAAQGAPQVSSLTAAQLLPGAVMVVCQQS